MRLKCKKHPKYEGNGAPRAPCGICIRMFLVKHPNMYLHRWNRTVPANSWIGPRLLSEEHLFHSDERGRFPYLGPLREVDCFDNGDHVLLRPYGLYYKVTLPDSTVQKFNVMEVSQAIDTARQEAARQKGYSEIEFVVCHGSIGEWCTRFGPRGGSVALWNKKKKQHGRH